MGARGRPIRRRKKGAHERGIAKTGRAGPTEEQKTKRGEMQEEDGSRAAAKRTPAPNPIGNNAPNMICFEARIENDGGV